MVKLIPQQDTNWALIQFTPQNISLTLKYRVKKIKNRKLKISHLAIWHAYAAKSFLKLAKGLLWSKLSTREMGSYC